MYWGAISTDIKKSSVNWNNAPEWMQTAVQFHNKIITQTVLYWKEKNEDKVKITKLPNSPEGDAFTFLFNHQKEFVLRSFVTRVAFDIQYLMALYRDKDGSKINMDCRDIKLCIKNEDIQEKFKNINYYGGIFIRIGMAFSDEAPMSYEYGRLRKELKTPKETKSYRGSVIYMSEEGEKRAEYDLVPYNNGDELVKVPAIKECYFILDDEGIPTSKLGFRDIKTIPKIPANVVKCKIKGRRSSITSQETPQKKPQQSKQQELRDKIYKILFGEKEENDQRNSVVEGYCKVLDSESLEIIEEINKYSPKTTIKEIDKGIAIFVKYHSVLDKSITEHDIAALKYIREEYDDLHKKANEAIEIFKGTGPSKFFSGGLIKQKRDDSSMYVLQSLYKDGSIARRMVNLYKTLARLLAFLPHKSSIGVAVGEMKEVVYNDVIDKGKYVDYFGPAVNLAARMEFKDFEYNTDWGVIDSRTHENRLAFTITGKMENNEDIISFMEESLEEDQMPFQIDYMPLKALNVGSKGEASIISTKISGIPHIKVGMKVEQIKMKTRTPKEQEVIDVLGDTLVLKNGNKIKINTIKLKL